MAHSCSRLPRSIWAWLGRLWRRKKIRRFLRGYAEETVTLDSVGISVGCRVVNGGLRVMSVSLVDIKDAPPGCHLTEIDGAPPKGL